LKSDDTTHAMTEQAVYNALKTFFDAFAPFLRVFPYIEVCAEKYMTLVKHI